MKRLSQEKMVEIVKQLRKTKDLTQEQLSVDTGINRQMIGRLEKREYMPSIFQLEKLAEVLGFDITDLYVENEPMVYTAYRSSSMSEEEKEGVDHMFEMSDACLLSHLTSSIGLVARQHPYLNALSMQFFDGLCGSLLQLVGNGKDAQCLFFIGQSDDRLGFCHPFLGFIL